MAARSLQHHMRAAAHAQLTQRQLRLPLGPVAEPGPYKPFRSGKRQRKRPVRGQLPIVFDRTVQHRNKRAREVGPVVIRQGKRVRLHVVEGHRAAIGAGRITWTEDYESALRPRYRWMCADVPRPCPYVSCQHHLYLDVTAKGDLLLNFPDLELDELRHSCALDEADEHTGKGIGQDGLARRLNLTREWARREFLEARQRFAEGWARLTGERAPLLDTKDDEPSQPEMGEIGDIEWD